MIRHKLMRAVAFLLVLLGTSAFALPPATQSNKLPSDSIYQLNLHLVDQGGKAFELRSLRGEPVFIAMFYASCKYTCPLIIEEIKRTVQALDEADRNRVRVLLVSFDPARDTPAALTAVSVEHHVNLAHWTLARTDPTGVRKLAAILGVQYRAMTNGDFNHSTMITLLDQEGRIAAKSDKTSALDSELIAAVGRTLAGQNP